MTSHPVESPRATSTLSRSCVRANCVFTPTCSPDEPNRPIITNRCPGSNIPVWTDSRIWSPVVTDQRLPHFPASWLFGAGPRSYPACLRRDCRRISRRG